MKRWLIIFALCLLVGCAENRRPTTMGEVYDFGLPTERLAEGIRWSSVALEVRAPHWFDSPAIEYRLLYEEPLKLRSYSASRWAGAPGQLLAQRLRQQLGVVGANAGQTAASCLLRFELQEFSQLFATPQRSRGLLQGSAILLDARRRILAEKAFASEHASPSADARGGVMALAAASDALGRQLGDWLKDLEKRGTLTGCRLTAGESQ
jgi:cholesterol transport system auxiliary component